MTLQNDQKARDSPTQLTGSEEKFPKLSVEENEF